MSIGTRRLRQRGGVLLIGLLLIVSVLSIGLIVIDIARLQRSAESLQRMADAAALAGAEFLKRGDQQCGVIRSRGLSWRYAKNAALRMIRDTDNPIYGAQSERNVQSAESAVRDQCYNDIDQSGDVNLPCRSFDFGDVLVVVERGYNFRRDEGGVYGDPQFVSLEGVFQTDPNDLVNFQWNTSLVGIPSICAGIGSSNAALPDPQGVDPTCLANGVRVRVTLKNLPLTMGALFRLFSGPSLAREAIASVDMPTRRGEPVNALICH